MDADSQQSSHRTPSFIDATVVAVKGPREGALAIAAKDPGLVANDQMQSILFNKLLIALRHIIYNKVVSGWIFCGIGLWNCLLGSVPEWILKMPTIFARSEIITCYQCGRHTVVRHVKMLSVRKPGLLSLLKTCRRVYASCYLSLLSYSEGGTMKRQLLNKTTRIF